MNHTGPAGSTARATLVASVLAFASCPCFGADTSHQIRSAFIYNFAKYIDFPAESLAGGKTFVVGVEGDDGYGGDLESALAGKLTGGRPFAVKRVHSESEMRSCQFLIVGETTASGTKRVLRAVQGTPVVTIGEGSDFAREGGVIAFVTQNNRIRFDINLAAAKESHISVSSRMLELAIQVFR